MDQYEMEEIPDYTPNIEFKFPPPLMKGNSTVCDKLPDGRISISKTYDDQNIKTAADSSPRGKLKKKFLISKNTLNLAKSLGGKGLKKDSPPKGSSLLRVPPKNLSKNPFLMAKVLRHSTKKLVQMYKKSKLYESPMHLGFFHYSIIDDKGAIFEKEEKKSLKNIIKSPFSKDKLSRVLKTLYRIYSSTILKVITNRAKKFVKKHIPTINSNSSHKILWDFFVFCSCFLCVFWYSIQRSFIPEENMNLSTKVMGCYLGLLILLYIDIGINLNTDYYQDGIQIKNRYKIFRKFFATSYLTDIIPCVSLSFFYFFNENEFFFNLFAVLILKLFKAGELFERVKNLLVHNDRSESLYQLMILLFTIFLWGHVLACLWHLIATKNSFFDFNDTNWLKSKNLEGSPWTTKYLYSFYWAFTTMLTVGYGDVIPTNNLEITFNIWAMFLGCGMFGYSMNSIGDILKFSGRKSQMLKEQMNRVDNMMMDKNIPYQTQIKVKKYLEFVWKQEQKEDPEYEKLVMGKLTSTLRDEINYFTNVKYMKSVACFEIFSEKTLTLLANQLQKVRFSPEEYIYKEGDFEDLNIYFVVDGNLKLVSHKGNKGLITWRSYKKGDCIGVQELFSGKARNFSVLSLDFSTLFQMSRRDFIDVLRRNPEDYEKFCFLKDQDILYNEKNQYKIKCESCGSKDHFECECSYFKYSPNKLFLIGRYNFSKKLFEKKFRRKRKRKINPLFYKNKFNDDLAQFQQIYSDDDEFNDLQEMYENINCDEDEYELNEKKTNKRASNIDFLDERLRKMDSEDEDKIHDPIARRRATRKININIIKGANQRKSVMKTSGEALPITEEAKKRVSKAVPEPLNKTIVEEEPERHGSSTSLDISSQKSLKSLKTLPKLSTIYERQIEKNVVIKFDQKVEEGPVFDKVRTFKYYFPRNNIDSICSRTNTIRVSVSNEEYIKKQILLQNTRSNNRNSNQISIFPKSSIPRSSDINPIIEKDEHSQVSNNKSEYQKEITINKNQGFLQEKRPDALVLQNIRHKSDFTSNYSGDD